MPVNQRMKLLDFRLVNTGVVTPVRPNQELA